VIGNRLKQSMLAAAIALVSLMGSSTAWAVSDEVRTDCLIEAYRVRPMLNAPQIEAYVANCIADATATPRRKRRSY
jgi:hypothetical protein